MQFSFISCLKPQDIELIWYTSSSRVLFQSCSNCVPRVKNYMEVYRKIFKQLILNRLAQFDKTAQQWPLGDLWPSSKIVKMVPISCMRKSQVRIYTCRFQKCYFQKSLSKTTRPRYFIFGILTSSLCPLPIKLISASRVKIALLYGSHVFTWANLIKTTQDRSLGELKSYDWLDD